MPLLKLTINVLLLAQFFQLTTAKGNQLKWKNNFMCCLECQFRSFYIQNNEVSEGKLLEHFPISDLNECASKCAEVI